MRGAAPPVLFRRPLWHCLLDTNPFLLTTLFLASLPSVCRHRTREMKSAQAPSVLLALATLALAATSTAAAVDATSAAAAADSYSMFVQVSA